MLTHPNFVKVLKISEHCTSAFTRLCRHLEGRRIKIFVHARRAYGVKRSFCTGHWTEMTRQT